MSRNTNREPDQEPAEQTEAIEEQPEFPSAAADGNPADDDTTGGSPAVLEDLATAAGLQEHTIPDAKVGDAIAIPGAAPAAMVRLPDGSVATVRGSYTVRHPGQHAIVLAMDGATTEVTFNVTEPGTE